MFNVLSFVSFILTEHVLYNQTIPVFCVFYYVILVCRLQHKVYQIVMDLVFDLKNTKLTHCYCLTMWVTHKIGHISDQ